MTPEEAQLFFRRHVTPPSLRRNHRRMGREASMEIERRGASFEGLAPLKSALVTLKAYQYVPGASV